MMLNVDEHEQPQMAGTKLGQRFFDSNSIFLE